MLSNSWYHHILILATLRFKLCVLLVSPRDLDLPVHALPLYFPPIFHFLRKAGRWNFIRRSIAFHARRRRSVHGSTIVENSTVRRFPRDVEIKRVGHTRFLFSIQVSRQMFASDEKKNTQKTEKTVLKK